MEIIVLTELNNTHKEQVFNLWNKVYPKNLSYASIADFDAYLAELKYQNHCVLFNQKQKTIGWYFSFIRENQPWFAIIIDPDYKGQNWGTTLLNKAKQKASVLNGWVIDKDIYTKQNGEIYPSPLNFYIKNGFKLQPQNRLELPHISAVQIVWNKA